MKKVVALNGDVTMDNLGLTDEQEKMIINEVDIVFHFAATLRLESKLKGAIEMNTVSWYVRRFTHFQLLSILKSSTA